MLFNLNQMAAIPRTVLQLYMPVTRTPTARFVTMVDFQSQRNDLTVPRVSAGGEAMEDGVPMPPPNTPPARRAAVPDSAR